MTPKQRRPAAGKAKKKNPEVERVQQDIEDMVNGLPPDMQRRWFRYKPESSGSKDADNYSPLPSPQKASTSNSSASSTLVKKETIDLSLDSDSDSETTLVQPSRKTKKRKKSQSVDDTPDTDDSSAVKMSFYLYVQAPPPPVLVVRKSSAKPHPPKTTDLGPFVFNSSILFSELLSIIATGCQTNVENFRVDTLQWKFDRPANSPRKSLSNLVAFEVMIKSLKDRHKDYVFSVFMLPPAPVKRELPWLNDDDGTRQGPIDFEYTAEELALPSGSATSIRDQIASIDESSKTQLNELLNEYPIDNNPSFPGKRIFHNETGYFNLDDIKLRVWAAAKARGTATIDRPPNSRHFHKDQTIQLPRTAAPSAAVVPLATPAPSSTGDLFSAVLSNPLLLQALFAQQMSHFPSYPPHPGFPPPGMQPLAPANPPLPAAPTASAASNPIPDVKLPRDITLDEYCERYKLAADIRQVLEELGYIPGDDGLLELDDEAWRSAKVPPLMKGRLIRQHRAFLKDVSNGLWDGEAPL
ncbi:putative proline-rich protein [Favolaschia claudopus]|uniref:Proline-rich protein n=1 Tax=Favolaschia claudopus TaxID=2862362 RepID=A0AAW0B7T4_9AGAR